MAKQDTFNLQRFIITVVIVGVTLVIGLYISDMLNVTLDTPGVATRAVNESLGAVRTGSAYTVAQASQLGFANMVVTQMLNNSVGSVVIPATNYTYTSAGVVTPVLSNVLYNNTIWRVTYTYTFTNQSAASSAATEVTNALSTGTAWISILVVVGFATVVLSMLTAGLGNTAREAQVPYY